MEKQGLAENDGTWGARANTVFDLIDAAIAGTAAVAHDDAANYTLTTANSATDEARQMVINVTGTLTAARNVVVPTSSKLYFVKNGTTGGFAFTVKTSAGTGISVPNGKTMVLRCDGTNVVEALDHHVTLSVGTMTSNLIFTDATYDIGASGATRPRDLFLSRNATVGGTLTVTGGQIAFPAAQNASANANTLDDYEEGTWTTSVGGTATYSDQRGFYTKIGRVVHVEGIITITLIGTGSTSTISGLPFTASGWGGGVVNYFSSLAGNMIALQVFTNGTTLRNSGRATAGSTADVDNPIFGNGARMDFNCTFYV